MGRAHCPQTQPWGRMDTQQRGRGWRGCSEGLGSAACCKHGPESISEGFLHQYLLTNIPETHWKSQVMQPRLLALYSGVLYSSMHCLLLLACLGF